MIELYEWWHFMVYIILSLALVALLSFGTGYFFFLGMKLAGY